MTKTVRCSHCQQPLEVDSNWPQINYCRGLTLLPWIVSHPGLSAWELAQVSAMAYSQVSKGLAKLRELEVIRGNPEQREAGGFRYRYYPWPDHEDQVKRLQGMMRHTAVVI